jgi:hypothetical protein
LQDHIPLLGGARGGFWKEIQIFRSTYHIHWVNTIPLSESQEKDEHPYSPKRLLKETLRKTVPPQSHLKGTLRKTEYNRGEIRDNTNVLIGRAKQKYCINDYPVGETHGRFFYLIINKHE